MARNIIILVFLALASVALAQPRGQWKYFEKSAAPEYVALTASDSLGRWVPVGELLSGANAVYGTGSAGRPAEWFTDSTLTYNSFTAGSVMFVDAGGGLAQDNANLFWDDGNNRLGIGTASPSNIIHAYKSGNLYTLLQSTTNNQVAVVMSPQSYNWAIGVHAGQAGRFKIENASAFSADGSTMAMVIDTAENVGIGYYNVSDFPRSKLDVQGDLVVNETIRVGDDSNPISAAEAAVDVRDGNVFIDNDNPVLRLFDNVGGFSMYGRFQHIAAATWLTSNVSSVGPSSFTLDNTTYDGVAIVPRPGTGAVEIWTATKGTNPRTSTKKFDINDDGNAGFYITGAVTQASGTTAQRPTGAAALLRYNTDTTFFEAHDGTQWRALADRTWTRANFVDGTGTADYVARWSDANTLTNSIIQDDGTTVGVNVVPSSNTTLSVEAQNTSTTASKYGFFSSAGASPTGTQTAGQQFGVFGYGYTMNANKANIIGGGLFGVEGFAANSSTNTAAAVSAYVDPVSYELDIDTAYGGKFLIYASNASSVFQTAYGVQSDVSNNPGKVHDAYSFHVKNIKADSNRYVLYVPDQNTTPVSDDYGLYIAENTMDNYLAGALGIARVSPAYALDVGTTTGIRIPVGTTAQRPTGAAGVIRYNSDSTAVEFHDGTAWATVGGGGSGDGNGIYDGNGSLSGITTITTGTSYANFSGTTNALRSTTTTGRAFWAVNNATNTAPILSTANPSDANTIVPVLELARQTSGTAAAGIGATMDVYIEHSTGGQPNAARYMTSYTDAAVGTLTAKYEIELQSSGSLTEVLELTPSQLTLLGASVIIGGSTGPKIIAGAGSPESSITAPVGSLYLRTDGGASTTLYVKESGTGNTGWIAK